MFGENQKGGGGDQEPWQQQPEESAQDSSSSELHPQDQQHLFSPSAFSGLRLKELDSIFQRSQYPDVFARKELTIFMDVSEAKVEASKPDESNWSE
ncbi:PREDICTED: rhox homeobox family member 1-like [Mandrillus leucophaeus]|uniref:rhox homeobox family member 1-like n=1 Tax=Mandrillus leucophaeus TaxID=9568 RepID=UPI0005F41B12|nr:PREDICTED: rhox homeobox family member 1-like [Mandrillus leucophaeus]